MRKKEDKITDLLAAKFYLKQKYLNYNKNVSNRGYGLLSELELENVAETDKPQLMKEFSVYKAQLEQNSDEEIDKRWNELQEQKTQEYLKEIESQKQFREKNLFFNQPGSNATEEELEYRAKMSYWTIEEALTLLFGKDPAVVKWDKIKDYKDKSPFAKEYSKIRELILRAISANEIKSRKDLVGLSPTTIRPADVLTWAQRKGIPFPELLEEKIRAQPEYNLDWENLYKEKCLENQQQEERIQRLTEELEEAKSLPHGKEKESMHKMIAGMATAKYGYIHGKKNTAAKNIVEDLERHGIDMDEGTARNFLKISGNNWLR